MSDIRPMEIEYAYKQTGDSMVPCTPEELRHFALTAEVIRLRQQADDLQDYLFKTSITLGAIRAGVHQSDDWYDKRDLMHLCIENAQALEAKIEKYLESGEWEEGGD